MQFGVVLVRFLFKIFLRFGWRISFLGLVALGLELLLSCDFGRNLDGLLFVSFMCYWLCDFLHQFIFIVGEMVLGHDFFVKFSRIIQPQEDV